MSLNLGLTRTEPKEIPTELSDVLSAELEFVDAYQDFLNYKNTCEIVIKAKSSTERLAFAQDLLGVSVENIEVSVEKLGTSLRRAWEKFVGWAKQAINYIKYSVLKYTLKKDGFSVEVRSRDALQKQIDITETLIKRFDTGKKTDWQKDLAVYIKFSNKTETITTRNEVIEVVKLAEKFIYALTKLEKRSSQDKDPDTSGAFTSFAKTAIPALQTTIKVIIALAKKDGKSEKKEEAAN